ncbi:MAG: hypothetical protein OXH31_08430 [Gammaproteobacteria bacterium]|nr:hypothetical protein [Gammaproteobacteria bacterium]
MSKYIGSTLLALCAFFASFVLANTIIEPADSQEYGNCEVREYRSDTDSITSVNLSCESHSKEEDENAWMVESVGSRDGKSSWSLKPVVVVPHSEDSIKVRYRFDKEDESEEIFSFSDYVTYTIATKIIDEKALEALLSDIEETEEIEFEFEDNASSVTKISLGESASKAVKDFRERIERMRSSENSEQQE